MHTPETIDAFRKQVESGRYPSGEAYGELVKVDRLDLATILREFADALRARRATNP